MQALVLAGGLGTRLRSAIPDLPKPMAPVAERPFLEWLLDYWIDQGITRFVLSVGFRHEAISEHFGDAYRSVPIAYAIEREPLGTGGGFVMATKTLYTGETFVVLNGDTLFEVDLTAMLDFHARRSSAWTLGAFRIQGPSRYDDLALDSAGRVVAFGGSGSGSGMKNGGVYVVAPHAIREVSSFEGRNCSLERDILPELIRRNVPVFAAPSNGRFLDIGIPEDYLKAAEFVSARSER